MSDEQTLEERVREFSKGMSAAAQTADEAAQALSFVLTPEVARDLLMMIQIGTALRTEQKSKLWDEHGLR